MIFTPKNHKSYFFTSLSISFCKFLANVLAKEDSDIGLSSDDIFPASDISVNFFIPISGEKLSPRFRLGTYTAKNKAISLSLSFTFLITCYVHKYRRFCDWRRRIALWNRMRDDIRNKIPIVNIEKHSFVLRKAHAKFLVSVHGENM